MEKIKNTVEDLNLESKIRQETIAELIAFLEDKAQKQELCICATPSKSKKDQEARINQNAGFKTAASLLKAWFTKDGRFANEKFAVGK